MASKNTATATATAVDTVKHESTRKNPVQFVRAFVVANHRKGAKALGRAEVCRQLEKMGIATHTAKTQYQRVHAMGYKLPKAAK